MIQIIEKNEILLKHRITRENLEFYYYSKTKNNSKSWLRQNKSLF